MSQRKVKWKKIFYHCQRKNVYASYVEWVFSEHDGLIESQSHHHFTYDNFLKDKIKFKKKTRLKHYLFSHKIK